nr:hypothetical protein [Mesorhizobium sp.]
MPPIERREIGQRFMRNSEPGGLAPLGENPFARRTAGQRRVDHARHGCDLANIGLAGGRRREQHETRHVVASGRRQRGQQGTKPEADQNDVRHAAILLQPIDRRAYARRPPLHLTGR